jgi:hypothetical protein
LGSSPHMKMGCLCKPTNHPKAWHNINVALVF